MTENLDIQFENAYRLASRTTTKLPPDVMLQFYAYYKQATNGNNYKQPSGNVELKSAFKLNAWFQLNHLTEKQAKTAYIELVQKHLK